MAQKLGFSKRDLDTTVRPQDDFYHYASGGWLKRNPVPDEEPRWGPFMMLRHLTDKQLYALLKKIIAQKDTKPNSPATMIHNLYKSGLNVRRRDTLGLTPLERELAMIREIKTPQEVVRVAAHLERVGGGGIWASGIDQDMQNSERYIVYLGQGGLGMPDRDYYLKNDAESVRVRTAYEKHLVELVKLAGRGEAAEETAKTVMRIETTLAKISMTKEDLRDVDKIYNKRSRTELKKIAPRVAWNDYFSILGVQPTKLIVMQPDFFKGAEKLLHSVSVHDWQAYLFTHLLNDFASSLTQDLEKENFAFYGTVLSGTTQMKPLWRRILRVVNGGLSEALGELYVREYFPPAAKKKVAAIVTDLFTAYGARIKNLDWMSSATKKKALKKLNEMRRKLGYPDKWKRYTGLVITSDDYLGNIMRITEYEHARAIKRLNKPVDRSEWFMSPQTVNAYCSFLLNDIVFPAAILQHPFFAFGADDAFNYGAIGSVIGHEITHGFDDQGSKFDGKGNRKTWWTPEDIKRFTKKTKRFVSQFNQYEVSGLTINGQLTLGENIADLGGISIAYDAYQLRLNKTGRKTIGGFTPEQRFFLGYAATERENERPESAKTAIMTDPHAPSICRVNGPMSNLPEFYAAFDVKKGDKLYRAPKDRAKIW